MKLLFVSHPFPWPPNDGGRQRRFHLVRELARRHEVTLLTLSPGDPADMEHCPLHDLCVRVIATDCIPAEPGGPRWRCVARNTWRLATELLPRAVTDCLGPRLIDCFRSAYGLDAFDAVWVDRYYFAEVARRAGLRRIVVDVDDVGSVCLERTLAARPRRRSDLYRYVELAKLRRYERGLTRRFWRAVVCKEADRRHLGGDPRRVFVVPNGIPDLPLCRPEAQRPGAVLFVGSLYYAPNVDAVRHFHADVLPALGRDVPEARFHVVGKDPLPEVAALHDAATVVHGAVPDVTPHYESAALVVAPIRLGSGTRLKVLEALGHGKALVATSTAVEGLDLRPGVDFEQADDPAAFAAACALLLRAPETRHRLGEAGRRRVYERYHWSAIARLAEQALAPGSRQTGYERSYQPTALFSPL